MTIDTHKFSMYVLYTVTDCSVAILKDMGVPQSCTLLPSFSTRVDSSCYMCPGRVSDVIMGWPKITKS